MQTFSAFFKKEIIESIRKFRYLVLAAGIVVFVGISSPVMMKLLPVLMKNQVPPEMANAFKVTKEAVYSGFFGDLFETASIFVLFGLSGILSDEMSKGRFVFPYLKGANPASIILAKAFHYILATSFFIFIGALIDYSYVSFMFEGSNIALGTFMISTLLACLYYGFQIVLLIFFSSLFKKGVIAGILTLVSSFISAAFVNVNVIGDIIPYKLISLAAAFSKEDVITPVIAAIAGIVILIGASIYRLKRVEIA